VRKKRLTLGKYPEGWLPLRGSVCPSGFWPSGDGRSGLKGIPRRRYYTKGHRASDRRTVCTGESPRRF